MRVSGNGWDYKAAIGVYVLSYLTYRTVLGLDFTLVPLAQQWQYLDLGLLENDLLRSLWYLHAQPPLMNLVVGLALKSGVPHVFLEALFFAAGLGAIHSLHHTLSLLAVPKGLALGALAGLCLFPTFMLFATWTYTTHLEFCLFCLLMHMLALCCVRPPDERPLVPFFLILAVLTLLRAHWAVAILAVMPLLLVTNSRRHVMKAPLALLAGLVPVLAVCAKNAAVFGMFGLSSWMGMNVGIVARNVLPPGELQQLANEQKISPYYPVAFDRWKIKQAYEAVGFQPPVTHPALEATKSADGMENYNSAAALAAGRQDMRDAKIVIGIAPVAYARQVGWFLSESLTMPSVSHVCCAFSLSNIRASGVSYDQLSSALQALLSGGSLLLYGVLPTFAFLLAAWKRGGMTRVQAGFVLISFWIALTMWVSAAALNGPEIERLRWGWTPAYLCHALILAGMIVRRKRTS